MESPQVATLPAVAVEELRDRIAACLQSAVRAVKISDLRSQMGYPATDDADPFANPVHRVLQEMIDVGQVERHLSQWDEPRFTIRPGFDHDKIAQLRDPALQEKYQEEARCHLRHLQCPTCGETDTF
jgi:hypothetical protein